VILNHPAALPDAAEQPLVTGRNGSASPATVGQELSFAKLINLLLL
jgi:hypothetical protein